MTKEEFVALPVGLALAALFDATPELADVPAPRVPFPPKYDLRLPRKGGYLWASECSLSSLQWWQRHKRERAAEGGQYADKDNALADKLDRWITWRMACPTERWSGLQGDGTVTSPAPVERPSVREYERRTEYAKAQDDEPRAIFTGDSDAEEETGLPF